MTRQQAQIRNHTIYRLRGQLNLFKSIPKDLVGFNKNDQKIMSVLTNKLEEALNTTRDVNCKYTYYCSTHLQNNPNGFIKTTRNMKARCLVCAATHYSSPLFYIKKDKHASTD